MNLKIPHINDYQDKGGDEMTCKKHNIPQEDCEDCLAELQERYPEKEGGYKIDKPETTHKNRITFDEFIDEQMIGYVNITEPHLFKQIIRDMMEAHVWDWSSVANELADSNRVLVEEKVEEQPLICKSCQDRLSTIVFNEYVATAFRVTRDGNILHLREDTRIGDSKVVSKVCSNCAEKVDLSEFEIRFVK